MDGFQPLVTIAALNLAAAISPGPAFMLITRTAAGLNRRSALLAAAGTVTASVIWAAAALLGLHVLLAKAAGIYRLVQLLGGLYLCFIGWSVWRGASSVLPVASGPESNGENSYRRGLLLGLSNPKVIVFFGTIFTTAFNPSTPVLVKWTALLIVLVNETLWYTSLATLFGVAPVQSGYRRLKAWFERIFGGLLFFFGARLAWTSLRE